MRQNDLSERMCLTLRLLWVSRGGTALLHCPWMPLSTPAWCAEDAGTVTHQLLYGHCFQCQEATVTWAYFKCMSSVSQVLKIVLAVSQNPASDTCPGATIECHPLQFGHTLGRVVGDQVGFGVRKGFHLQTAERGSRLVHTVMGSWNSDTRLNPTLLKDLLKFSGIFTLPPMLKGACNQV